MKKKKGISIFGVAFAALAMLVLAFLLRISLHRSPVVTLPETDAAGSGGDVITDAGQEAIRRVEVTPETVQRVIERLARPENYSRTVTIERFWTDGGAETTVQVQVADGWTRIDAYEDGGELRHAVTGDGRSWIWYGAGEAVFSGAAALTADEEQSIPTYEDILRLDTAVIAEADYRTREGVNCIYVSTAADDALYAERYWIAVDSGLLVAAEYAMGEEMVYRMKGFSAELGVVTGEAFRLPDGTYLVQMRESEEAVEQEER